MTTTEFPSFPPPPPAQQSFDFDQPGPRLTNLLTTPTVFDTPPPAKDNTARVVAIVLGAVLAVVVLIVVAIAGVTLLGSNAESKFDDVGRDTPSVDHTPVTLFDYDPEYDLNDDGYITVDDIPEHSVAECYTMDLDTDEALDLCVATGY